MSQSFALQGSNGVPQVVVLPGAVDGYHTIVIAAAVAPSAGYVSVEYRTTATSTWRPLRLGENQLMTGGAVVIRIDGPINALRVTFFALVGGSGFLTAVSTSAFPVHAADGLAAIITQGYPEANVKLGVQFYARAAWPTADQIAAGTTRKIHFRTGAKTVLVKLRVFDYVGEELSLALFEGATGVTGGTAVPVRNYNRRNPVGSTVAITKNVTTTSDGTVIDDGEFYYGSSNAPQRNPGSIPSGRERILLPNTSYIIAITGTAALGNSRAQYFVDWYEGETDLPL